MKYILLLFSYQVKKSFLTIFKMFLRASLLEEGLVQECLESGHQVVAILEEEVEALLLVGETHGGKTIKGS